MEQARKHTKVLCACSMDERQRRLWLCAAGKMGERALIEVVGDRLDPENNMGLSHPRQP